MEKKTLIIGPSHIKRWVHNIKSKVLPELDSVEFYGKGGMPIWHDFSEKKEEDFENYDEIIYIIGDFRFGNGSLFQNVENSKNNTLGIDKNLIKKDNDTILYERTLSKCHQLVSQYNNKVKFIFWDLALREFKNKNNNSYFTNNTYKHPTWNLNEVEAIFPRNIIPLLGVDVSSFFIDESNHPSFHGYLFLYNKLLGYKADYKRSINIDEIINSEKILLCGDSSLIIYINLFIDFGILKGTKLNFVKLGELNEFANNSNKKIIFFSNIRSRVDNEKVFIKRVDRLNSMKQKHNLDVVLWEAFTQEIVSERGYKKLLPQHALFRHKSLSSVLSENVSYFPSIQEEDAQALVDLNTTLQPTIFGILWGLLYHTGSLDLYKYESMKLKSFFRQSKIK